MQPDHVVCMSQDSYRPHGDPLTALLLVCVQNVNPRLLIFVEGTSGNNFPVQTSPNQAGYWWGGEPPYPMPPANLPPHLCSHSCLILLVR